jgi:hypothetical protein
MVLAAPGDARAAEEADDGAYGRFDGDVALELGAGAAFASGGPVLDVETGAFYLYTAGAYFRYTDALGRESPDVRRALAAGLQLRPLFLARYAKNMESGPARLDLLVDSIAFQVGAFWDERRAREGGEGLASEPGLEFGVGLDLPILGRASGPFVGLRGILRWRTLDLEGKGDPNAVDRGAFLAVILAWHQVLGTHIVDVGDAVVR